MRPALTPTTLLLTGATFLRTNAKYGWQIIGCMNANGDLVVVEIDDSKYFHRKYHRLQWREGHWVFKGIKHNTGKCFLTEVPDCSTATLEPRICHHLLSGFHIISDGWPAYANIDQIGGGMVPSLSYCSSATLCGARRSRYPTKHVKNKWMRSNQKLNRQFGTT